MATFTTWTALKQQMLDDLASGNTTVGAYVIGSLQLNYKSFLDWKRLFEMVEEKVQSENKSFVGRTFAKNGGRG